MEAIPKLPMLIFELKMSASDVEFDVPFKKVSVSSVTRVNDG